MIRDDYILRMIDQIAALVAKLLKKTAQSVQEVQLDLESAAAQWIGFDYSALLRLSGASLLRLLSSDGKPDAEKCYAAAQLLYADARLREEQGPDVGGGETHRVEDVDLVAPLVYAAPHGVYQCQGDDRWCTIAVFDDEEWKTFCREMGKPELAENPRFVTLLNRKKNEEELNTLISEWTADRTPEAVMEQLQAAGIPAGVVKNTADMYVDPQLNARGMYWKIDHPEMGEFTHLGQSFMMSETPARPYRHSPLIGEHTQYICSELLGMSDEEFVNLMAQGVFE